MIHATPPEITCLAQVIHHEARGEPLKGKEAVAQVVINRVKSSKFPNSICKVVSQPHQFTGYHHRLPAPQKAYNIAKRVLSYSKSIHHWLYFNTIGPKRAIRIGNHFFWK